MAPKRREPGEGSVYKDRHGQWWAAARIAGRLVRRRAPDRATAETLRRGLIAQRDQGIDVGAGGQRVEAWLNVFYALKARDLKPRTLGEYRRYIEGYILPAIGQEPLNKVRPDMLQALLDKTQDEIRAAHGGRFSGGRTAQALATFMREAFGLAVERRLIPFNPMDGVRAPRHRSASPEPPTEDQIAALLAAAVGHPLEPLWHLYALLGLRRGEGLGLRWSDYDARAATLRIAQQVQAVDGARAIGTPKSEAGARVLPVPAAVCALLDQRRAAQLAQRVRRANTWQDHDLIFTSRDGGMLWPRNVEDDFYAIRGRAGLPATITMHALRHAVATLLDEAGASEALKAAILGHEKKTTTQRYTRGRLDAMRRVIEAVAADILRRAA